MPTDKSDRPSTTVILSKENRRWFKALAILGIVLTLLEYGMSWYSDEDMNHLRLFVATCLAFVGLYGMAPTTLSGAGALIYTWTSGIITIVWPGRRKSDPPGTKVITEIDGDQSPPAVETRVEPPARPSAEG